MSTEKRKYELRARAEAQQRTGERIAAAAASLHEEVGIARTTVAEIARRAGVQRLTVYNHFPGLGQLLPACSAHYMERNPQPDLARALALEDPRERVREVLCAFYAWYRRTEPMTARVQGERDTVPELDAWMRQTADAPQARLADALAAGFPAAGEDAGRLRALVGVALDFWTWRRLAREGLDDGAAAALMAEAVGCAARP